MNGAAHRSRRAFRCRRDEVDPVMAHLADAVLPLFGLDENYRSAMLQHRALSICAHVFFEAGDAVRTDLGRLHRC